MSSKRSRVVRSSSTGEFGLLNLLKPKKSPLAQSEKKRATAAPVGYPKPIPKLPQKENLKPKVPVKVSEQPCRSIFSLGSPVWEKGRIGDGSGRKIGERCFHCKKEIAENEDLFMYGYLQAFCSPECRDEQIALDSKNRKPSPEPPAAAAVTKLKKEPAKGLFGSQVKKYTIAKFK